MNNETDKLLFGANAGTTSLTINDASLHDADIDIIGRRLQSLPGLKELKVYNSQFSPEMLVKLFKVCSSLPQLQDIKITDDHVVHWSGTSLTVRGGKLTAAMLEAIAEVASFYPELERLAVVNGQMTDSVLAGL